MRNGLGDEEVEVLGRFTKLRKKDWAPTFLLVTFV
jgi:hypothetical protein